MCTYKIIWSQAQYIFMYIKNYVRSANFYYSKAEHRHEKCCYAVMKILPDCDWSYDYNSTRVRAEYTQCYFLLIPSVAIDETDYN